MGYQSISKLAKTFLALSALALCSCQAQAPDPRNLTPMVSIEGSDTMGDLLKIWADEFMKENPAIPVSINKGDTSAGIAALIARTTDLASASRDLNDEERKLARRSGVDLKRITVARDSVAVIANADNPVSELTLKQVREIFTGEITDWSKVGGNKMPIKLFTREGGSGTSKYFDSHILKQKPISKNAQAMQSIEGLIDAVSSEKGAVGYAGMGVLSPTNAKLKGIKLKLIADTESVAATAESATENYPLSRPLYMFMDEHPKDSAKKFMDFCLGANGQKLVKAAGYASMD